MRILDSGTEAYNGYGSFAFKLVGLSSVESLDVITRYV